MTAQSYARSDIAFVSAGLSCRAWLYRPNGNASEKRPVIVAGHGLGATKDMGLDAYAAGFANAGYLVIAFDYRHFGASEGTPRQLLSIGKQRADWRAAIDFARTVEGADPRRVILFGISFGGGHVIASAARDKNIAAVIAQCPFTSGFASSRTVSPLTTLGIAWLGLRDLFSILTGGAPVLVPLAGRPGQIALMNTHDAWDGFIGQQPPGGNAVNGVTARSGFALPLAHPGRQARHIACPIFFGICDKDTVAPVGPTLRYAAQAPKTEITRYPCGHFDIYRGANFDRIFQDMRRFLERHVPVGG
jgi:pimeloyl-ACP methyl ester carboxylesterase